MKKLISVLACLFLLLSIPVEGLAASSTEKIGVLMKEIGVAVSLPANMYVITRDTPKDATVWNRFTFDPEEFIAGMNDDGTQFYAVAEDRSYTIYAWASDAQKNESFNLYDSEQLQVLYDEIIADESNASITAAQQPIHKSGTKTFLVFDYFEAPDSDIVSGRQYWTSYGGKNVNIKLDLFDGEITAHHKVVLEEIVDSMIIEPKPEENKEVYIMIPEIGVAAAFPSNMYVLTRETPKNSDVWAGAGFEYKEISQFMLDEKAYLIAMPGDFSYEIIVRNVKSGTYKDFNSYKSEKLEKIYADILAQDVNADLTACQNPIYHTETKTFLRYDGCSRTLDGDTYYRVYQTVHEGKEITVALYSYTGEIEDSHNDILERIADTMIID